MHKTIIFVVLLPFMISIDSSYGCLSLWKGDRIGPGSLENFEFDKILVTTGFYEENGRKTEIIDLSNSSFRCDLLDDISSRTGAIGGRIQNQPVICGGAKVGYYYQDCIIIGQTEKKLRMLERRVFASSTVLNNEKLWIVGGIGGDRSRNSSEFISLDQESKPLKGPDLPFNISSHCMIQFNSEAIYIIGGRQDGSISNKTWIFDPNNYFKISEGPELNVPRMEYACGKLEIGGKIFIIVAGGWTGNYGLSSVELLDPTSNHGWFFGPKLPSLIFGASMVTSPGGQGVILIGGYNALEHQISKSLIELKSSSMDCEEMEFINLNNETIKEIKCIYYYRGNTAWNVLDQTLQYSRKWHIALPISDDFANCDYNIFGNDGD